METAFDIIPANTTKQFSEEHVVAICKALLNDKDFYKHCSYFTRDGHITIEGSNPKAFVHTPQEFNKALDVLQEKGYHIYYDPGSYSNPSYHLYLTQNVNYRRGHWLF